jgi:hypothetical protein
MSVGPPLPLQPSLGDPAQECLPDYSRLRLQRGELGLYLLNRHREFHRNVLHRIGLTLLRGLLAGGLELGLKFGEEIRRDLAGLDGLGHTAEEPGLKGLSELR